MQTHTNSNFCRYPDQEVENLRNWKDRTASFVAARAAPECMVPLNSGSPRPNLNWSIARLRGTLCPSLRRYSFVFYSIPFAVWVLPAFIDDYLVPSFFCGNYLLPCLLKWTLAKWSNDPIYMYCVDTMCRLVRYMCYLVYFVTLFGINYLLFRLT